MSAGIADGIKGSVDIEHRNLLPANLNCRTRTRCYVLFFYDLDELSHKLVMVHQRVAGWLILSVQLRLSYLRFTGSDRFIFPGFSSCPAGSIPERCFHSVERLLWVGQSGNSTPMPITLSAS